MKPLKVREKENQVMHNPTQTLTFCILFNSSPVLLHSHACLLDIKYVIFVTFFCSLIIIILAFLLHNHLNHSHQ